MRCSPGLVARIPILPALLLLLLLLLLLYRTKTMGMSVPNAHAPYGKRKVIVIIRTGNTTNRTGASIARICRKIG